MSEYEPGSDGFSYDAEGIPDPDTFVIPDDIYTLRVKDVKMGRSKVKDDGTGGYQQANVSLVVDDGERKNFPVNFHYVTFSPKTEKGAGMAIKWLKTIGEPWEGQFKVSPRNWIGKRLRGFLEAKEYKGKKNMKVAWVEPIEAAEPEVIEAPGEDESLPF